MLRRTIFSVSLHFGQYITGVAMTTMEREAREIRKKLAQDGACPFQIASIALARNAELEREVARLEGLLRLRPATPIR